MLSRWVKNVIESDINLAPFFACMVDETTDISEKTQFSIVVRLVDSNGEFKRTFGDFMALMKTERQMVCVMFCVRLLKNAI